MLKHKKILFLLLYTILFVQNSFCTNNMPYEELTNEAYNSINKDFGNKENKNITDIIDKVLKSVVSIRTENINDSMKFIGGYSSYNKFENISEIGSGFVISDDGYIITNNHVIENAENIFVKINNEEIKAELIGSDFTYDIALLKINIKQKLPFLFLKGDIKQKIGERVIVIGNPYDLGISVSTGIISALDRSIRGTEYTGLIQTDAAINRGNSGGPMFNENGDVIGVNSLIFSSDNGDNIGLGFAIPISNVLKIVDQLKEFGYIQRGWLGIKGIEISQDVFKLLNSKRKTGIFVKDILKNSPAEKAGILPTDVIISYDGKHVENLSHLLSMIRDTGYNTNVDILVLRNEKYIKLKALIKDSPENAKYDEIFENIKSTSIDILDMILVEVNKSLIEKYELYNNLNGLYVLDVKKDGWGEFNNIEKGDTIIAINQTQIKSKIDLIGALEKIKNSGNRDFLMIVRKNKNKENIVLRLNFNIVNY